MDTCNQILESYIKWIKDNTVIKSINDGQICAISTPFLDRHNDHIDIYVKKEGNNYILTDDGYTINDLKLSGLEIKSPKREKIFHTIVNGFGVKIQGDNITTVSDKENLGQKKHRLVQAILAVNDMFNLSQETVQSLFKEDVELFFRSNNIFFSKDIKITGKTGFDHNIDFIIPSSINKPERLIQTINTPTRDTISLAVFAFNDISQVRNGSTKHYVIYNDIEKRVSSEAISALTNYDINSIPWSGKENYLIDLALN